MSARGLTYDEALSAYFTAIPGAMQPSCGGSYQDKRGRWVLRNVRGFLAYVTTRGVVLDQRFGRIGSVKPDPLTFDQARALFLEVCPRAPLPSYFLSSPNREGRWAMRNSHRLLAYVTPGGEVYDRYGGTDGLVQWGAA
ncbi:protein of unknown function [Thauera humireducens]|nr:protein of unknown function [Thauera humireducens]